MKESIWIRKNENQNFDSSKISDFGPKTHWEASYINASNWRRICEIIILFLVDFYLVWVLCMKIPKKSDFCERHCNINTATLPIPLLAWIWLAFSSSLFQRNFFPEWNFTFLWDVFLLGKLWTRYLFTSKFPHFPGGTISIIETKLHR